LAARASSGMRVALAVTAIILFVGFFFSSRRRHTRSKRDWSSDVCSSDLGVPSPHVDALAVATEVPGADVWAVELSADALVVARRSEERRVGKERRSRRAANP